MRKSALLIISLVLAVTSPPAISKAETDNLRLHHYLPATSTIPAEIISVWKEKVEAASAGQLKIEMYPSMTLGGAPPQLITQAKDGVVDLAFTVVGYTPGLFPRTEVFELPFMMEDAEATSKAFWHLFKEEMEETEFKDLKILGTWVHGPGVLHCNGAEVHKLDDLRGLKIRGPSQIIVRTLEALGAIPIGMPVPSVPQALQKNVIDCTALPYEVIDAFRIQEMTDSHTEMGGAQSLYTITFVLAMNKTKYESLTPEQKKWLDENSGLELSGAAGRIMQQFDAPAKEKAVIRGNRVITISGEELEHWKAATKPVVQDWIEKMSQKGIDGQRLIDRARALIDEYQGH